MGYKPDYRKLAAEEKEADVNAAPPKIQSQSERDTTPGMVVAKEALESLKRHTKERESFEFPTECMDCHKSAITRMCLTEIPNFKEVVIMCFACPHCGIRDV